MFVPASLFAREVSCQTNKRQLPSAPFQEEGVAREVVRCQEAAHHADDALKQRHLAVPAQLTKASVTVWQEQRDRALPRPPMVLISPSHDAAPQALRGTSRWERLAGARVMRCHEAAHYADDTDDLLTKMAHFSPRCTIPG